MIMLTDSDVKIVCKAFDDEKAPEYFKSYTIDGTSFYFSLSWNGNFTDRSYYSNDTIIWDFGDGTNYTGASAKHFYKFPNLYDVSATIFNKEGNAQTISLSERLTASNVFPDHIYLHPLDPEGYSYFLQSGKPSNQIIVTRYNSWQNEPFLKENNYTINLYVSGSNSGYMSLSSYYSEKYSHLKAYHGFVKVYTNENNYLQTKMVESTTTDSVSVFAVPYNTGALDENWDIKFNFYDHYVSGSSFVGSSGTNKDTDYIYFIDQKPSGNYANQVDIIYYRITKDFNFSEDKIRDFIRNTWNLAKNLFQKVD